MWLHLRHENALQQPCNYLGDALHPVSVHSDSLTDITSDFPRCLGQIGNKKTQLIRLKTLLPRMWGCDHMKSHSWRAGPEHSVERILSCSRNKHRDGPGKEHWGRRWSSREWQILPWGSHRHRRGDQQQLPKHRRSLSSDAIKIPDKLIFQLLAQPGVENGIGVPNSQPQTQVGPPGYSVTLGKLLN